MMAIFVSHPENSWVFHLVYFTAFFFIIIFLPARSCLGQLYTSKHIKSFAFCNCTSCIMTQKEEQGGGRISHTPEKVQPQIKSFHSPNAVLALVGRINPPKRLSHAALKLKLSVLALKALSSQA